MNNTDDRPSAEIAVITGAARGIGRRTAELLAARGFRLALVDIADLDDTCRAIAGNEAGVLRIRGDITSEEFVQSCAQQVEERWGRVDVLVNNAGVSWIKPAEQTTTAAWRRVLEVNLTAPFVLSRVFGAAMLRRRHGAIVNVASIAGIAAVADRAAYNASKHGLIGLTRTLAAEWGGFGVRTNAVCPGWVKTEMDEVDQSSGAYRDADIEARVPMGRFAFTSDIAEAIAFLADPERSGFVNGHCLVVDGGWTADASWDSLRLRHR